MSAKPVIAFAGTPQFAVSSLQALLDADVGVTLVLTQPDRAAGRGRTLAPGPVKRLAMAHGIAMLQPARLRGESIGPGWGPVPDLLVVVAYGLVLPQWLLDWPRRGAVNVHASLLPRWRGAAPIQHAILAGEQQTGVSVMQLEQGLDVGPVFSRRSLPIGARETAGELHDRLATLGAGLLLESLPGILSGSLRAVPQEHESATYAPKITKADAAMNWGASAAALDRCVRAYNPWPVCEALTSDGRRLRIWEAEPLDVPTTQSPGSIIAATPQGIDVATGDGMLRVLLIQPPSGKVMTVGAYLAAHPLQGCSFVA